MLRAARAAALHAHAAAHAALCGAAQAPARELAPLLAAARRARRAAPLSTDALTIDAATTSYLRNLDNGAEVYLVGTAHVSRKSAEEVRNLIRAVKPSTVLVELCPARAKRLMAQRSEAGTQLSVLAKLQRLVEEPGTVRGKLLGLAMRIFLAPERKAGLESGKEFEVALQEAAALNAHVIHGDRDISTTMTRLAGTLSLFGILRFVASPPALPPSLQRVCASGAGMEDSVEALKNRRTLAEITAFMRCVAPEAVVVLLDERDDALAAALRRAPGPRVVAVVGLAHVDGIEARWAAANDGRAGGAAAATS